MVEPNGPLCTTCAPGTCRSASATKRMPWARRSSPRRTVTVEATESARDRVAGGGHHDLRKGGGVASPPARRGSRGADSNASASVARRNRLIGNLLRVVGVVRDASSARRERTAWGARGLGRLDDDSVRRTTRPSRTARGSATRDGARDPASRCRRGSPRPARGRRSPPGRRARREPRHPRTRCALRPARPAR